MTGSGARRLPYPPISSAATEKGHCIDYLLLPELRLLVPRAWDSAEPAAFLDVALVRPSRRTLDAARAAAGLVCLRFTVSPPLWLGRACW